MLYKRTDVEKWPSIHTRTRTVRASFWEGRGVFRRGVAKNKDPVYIIEFADGSTLTPWDEYVTMAYDVKWY